MEMMFSLLHLFPEFTTTKFHIYKNETLHTCRQGDEHIQSSLHNEPVYTDDFLVQQFQLTHT